MIVSPWELNRSVAFGSMAAVSGTRTPMGEKDIGRAQVMGVSYRQAKRVLRLYREDGAAGLVHRNVGRPSGRRSDEALRRAVLQAYQESYTDFGPTLACSLQRTPLPTQPSCPVNTAQ